MDNEEKLRQSKENLRKIFAENPALKQAFKETLDEMRKPENIENRVPRTVELIPSMAKILKDHIVDMNDYEYIFQSRKGINQHIGVRWQRI